MFFNGDDYTADALDFFTRGYPTGIESSYIHRSSQKKRRKLERQNPKRRRRK